MEENTSQEKTAKPVRTAKAATAASGDEAQKRPMRPLRTNRPMNSNVQAAPRQPNGAKPMDARALNKLSMPELTKLAVNYNLEDISGLRKQELIGRIVAVCWKFCPTVLVFCARKKTTIWPGPRIFMFPRRRLNALACAKETPLKG